MFVKEVNTLVYARDRTLRGRSTSEQRAGEGDAVLKAGCGAL